MPESDDDIERLWKYVREVDRMLRAEQPELFTPWGASIPYTWSALPHRFREASVHFEAARGAALSLVSNRDLCEIYEADGAEEWLSDQVENLARRSALLAGGTRDLRSSFDEWMPRFRTSVNTRALRMAHATELYGIAPGPAARLEPVTSRDWFPVHGETTQSWITGGDIEDALAKYRYLRPPNLASRWGRMTNERPDGTFLVITTAPKSADSLRYLDGIHSTSLHEYLSAARLVTGRRLAAGGWLNCEISPFPRRDSHYFEVRDARGYWDPAPTPLTSGLHRKIRRAQPLIERFIGRYPTGKNDGTPLAYAHKRLEAILEGDRAWYDEILDCVSAVEALLTDHSSGRRGGPGKKQLAQRLLWLSGLSSVDGKKLHDRFDSLYEVRNRLIHSGEFQAGTFRRALNALDVSVDRGPDAFDWEITSSEWEAWQRDARPRLLSLLRWTFLACTALETEDDQSVIGWPFRGQRTLDLDIALGRRASLWRKRLRHIDSALSDG